MFGLRLDSRSNNCHLQLQADVEYGAGTLEAKRDAIVFARHRSNQRQARCCTSHPPIRAGQSAQLLQGNLGFGCKPDVLGSACLLPTRIVFGPDFRQVQLPSHRPACRSAWPSPLARCAMNCSNFLDKSIMPPGRIKNVHITSYFMDTVRLGNPSLTAKPRAQIVLMATIDTTHRLITVLVGIKTTVSTP